MMLCVRELRLVVEQGLGQAHGQGSGLGRRAFPPRDGGLGCRACEGAHAILVNVLQNKALSAMMNVEKGNGLQAWRRLKRE